ncbi:uncharacterized protein [Macrobrachium rosenbergii]|uniref:uncharacterized protein n=1 Tax=Macrobrachium rosenbergii TaxID=79674 RepID=UPI0034D4068D
MFCKHKQFVGDVCEKGLYCLVNATTKTALKKKVNGCNLKPFFERAASKVSSPPLSPPSPSVQIVGDEQQEIDYKFCPLTVAKQRDICNNSGRLKFRKKSGPSGKINKIFKNTSEPLLVKDIEGDGNCLFRSLSYAITGEEDQHAVIRSLICDYASITEKTRDDSMRQDKVWGTTTEILAAANLFNVNVFVWAKFGPTHTWHIHKPKDSVVNETVYLENKSGFHFNVVVRI